MIEKLSTEQIEGMFNAMPFQLLFIDENDRVRYWNDSKARLMEPPQESLGKDVRDCHKESSLPKLEKMLSDFKSGKKDEGEFWVIKEDWGILHTSTTSPKKKRMPTYPDHSRVAARY